MTLLQRAEKWCRQNLQGSWLNRPESLATEFTEVEQETMQGIATWLNALEDVLYREYRRTDDPELRARRGIYEGIAREILDGKWRR